MATHATRKEMLAAFGPYAVAFEPIGKNRTPYLSLLHLARDRAAQVVTTIRDVAIAENTEPYVLSMLRDINWRPHLVAAVATYFRAAPLVIEQMWAALDAGSWVAPQLAAVLSTCDGSFGQRAMDRLQKGCQVLDDPEYRIESPIVRHSAQGPSGTLGRSAKSASSLFALLQATSTGSRELDQLAQESDLQRLISSDVDNGGAIATTWLSKLGQIRDQA